MRNRFFYALLTLIPLMFSCVGGNVKYPAYTTYNKPQQTYNSAPAFPNYVYINPKLSILDTGLKQLRAKQCKQAVNTFKKLPQGFEREFCLSLSYGYCSNIIKSKTILKKIEPIAKDTLWKSRVYAMMSLMDILSTKKLFRDYATISYAYDSTNKLASSLMFKKKPNISDKDKKKYFDTAFSWCEEMGLEDDK